MVSRQRWGAWVAATGLALSLTACGGDEDPTPTAPPEPVQETVAPAEETTPAAPATQEATTAPDDGAATTEPGQAAATDGEGQTEEPASPAAGDGELTPPGTELQIGEDAVIQMASLADPEDDYYRYLKVRATVTEIAQADPSLLDGVQLATPLEDEVPYLIWADLEILETEGDYEITEFYPQLGARHQDGSSATTILGAGPIGDCASEDYPSLEPGSTARMCVVALADAGEQIGQVTWAGNDNADGGGDYQANAYDGDPVVWTE